jgi:hypothetical protein
VNSLDVIELDVGRGRRPGDEHQRAAVVANERSQPADRLGNELHDPLRLEDAHVEVRDERQGASTVRCTAGENDGAGLRDCEFATSEHAVECLQLRCRELGVFDRFEARRTPRRRKLGRDAETAHASASAGVAPGPGGLAAAILIGAIARAPPRDPRRPHVAYGSSANRLTRVKGGSYVAP